MNEQIPALRLDDVTRMFGGGAVRAVDGVSLEVEPGEIVSILGPSGCGKTTLMRMVAGLDHPTTGDIQIFGKSVLGLRPNQRNIGLVFQSLAVFPHMSVKQNIGFGLRMKRVPKDQIEIRVKKVMELVQLPEDVFGERSAAQLSGGQLQRVALARTLVTEPSVVMFDEPMAALDRRLRDYMAAELRDIQKRLGVAAIYVTHDQETASTMSDRLAIMNAGRIVQVGSPRDVYATPRSRFVANFLGNANLVVPTGIERRQDGTAQANVMGNLWEVPLPPEPTRKKLAVMFRPEHTDIHAEKPAQASLKGMLIGTQFVSGLYSWKVQLDDGEVVWVQSADNKLATEPAGQAVWISVKPGHARLILDE